MNSKKLISLGIIGAMLIPTVLSGCGSTVSTVDSNVPQESTVQPSTTPTEKITLPEDGGFKTVTYTPSSDKYRTYYEIFPYAFYDSDGDGIGDLKGITSKLDYINDGNPSTTDDLGAEGIWLMPIMPSPSYHKYNIYDYKDIDEAYGTIDDFKNLVEEAHKRNIDVIIDFVINHTSRKHEWFQKAVAELKEGKTDGYAQYYHFERNHATNGWKSAGADDWYYECEFDMDMPDLNLTNEKVRKEIEDIVKYWVDLGVDGFRLDAVKWYESTGTDDSVKDMKWLYDYAKSIKDDVYMVGECWDGSNVISTCYESGIDSFFNFDMQGSSGRVAVAVNTNNAIDFVKYLESWQDTLQSKNPDAIDTPFISNHDTARSAGFLMSKTKQEMAATLYILSPGNSFIYYGEEIGMTGSATDPDKRTGMYWSATDKTGYVSSIPGATNKAVPEKSVEEQLKDDSSLLTFYKRVIALKNQNPEIARGDVTAVDLGNNATAGYIAKYNDSQVMVIFNTSDKSSKVTVPADKFTVKEVRGYVIAEVDDSKPTVPDFLNVCGTTDSSESTEEVSEFSVTGSEIVLPPCSAIVLK